MDPMTATAIASTALQALGMLRGGGDVSQINRSPAMPGGGGISPPGGAALPQPIPGAQNPAIGQDPNIWRQLAQTQIKPPAQQGFAGVRGSGSEEKQTPGPKPPAGGGEQAPSTGAVLAAIPAAMEAAAPFLESLFGGDTRQQTQTAAPVAGSASGGIVPGLSLPQQQPLNIGQLLAALPRA